MISDATSDLLGRFISPAYVRSAAQARHKREKMFLLLLLLLLPDSQG